MPDAHYTLAELAAFYDLECGWSVDRSFYLALAGPSPISILDLGCGTGLICNAFAAAGHDVTGLDPASAMLDIARKKPQGSAIEWVEGDARDFTLGKRFDLIIMTGHAFQVLLSDAEIGQLFACVRTHLAPAGRFVFESRNPDIDWQSQWTHARSFDTPEGKLVVRRDADPMRDARLTFRTHYLLNDQLRTSESTLYFPPHETIERLAEHAGLKVTGFIGDWVGSAFDPKSSEEMIFTLGAA